MPLSPACSVPQQHQQYGSDRAWSVGLSYCALKDVASPLEDSSELQAGHRYRLVQPEMEASKLWGALHMSSLASPARLSTVRHNRTSPPTPMFSQCFWDMDVVLVFASSPWDTLYSLLSSSFMRLSAEQLRRRAPQCASVGRASGWTISKVSIIIW